MVLSCIINYSGFRSITNHLNQNNLYDLLMKGNYEQHIWNKKKISYLKFLMFYDIGIETVNYLIIDLVYTRLV